MKLTIANHLYTWDPFQWLHNWAIQNYGTLRSKTLDRTMHWHDVLSDWIDVLPDNVPAKDFDTIQELRRDIGHYRIDLLANKIDKVGYDFENRKNSPIVPE